MNKKLILIPLSIFILFLTFQSVSAHYYDDYNERHYSKIINEDRFGRTIEIKKETPYRTSYYYSSTNQGYLQNYNPVYDYWQYGPRYDPYNYQRYYSYGFRKYNSYNSLRYDYMSPKDYRYFNYPAHRYH